MAVSLVVREAGISTVLAASTISVIKGWRLTLCVKKRGDLTGKLFRIGHLGDMTEVHLVAAISGAEMAMLHCSIKVAPGSGTTAKRYWRHHSARSELSAREIHNNTKETNGTHSISR